MKAASSSPWKAVWALVLVTGLYLVALVWMDMRGTFQQLRAELLPLLGAMLMFTAASLSCRFARWHWLLGRSGHAVPWADSLKAYLAGFAFTASPGKVGELVRIRYFRDLGVPQSTTFGLFVFERSLDLACVLALALLAVADSSLMRTAAAFVAVVIGVVAVLVMRPGGLSWLADQARRLTWSRLAALVDGIAVGLVTIRQWLNWRMLIGAVLLGLAAWGLLAIAFVWLLGRLGLDVPLPLAAALYPLAMLAGAASMIPGGIGSTEAAIVWLLGQQAVPVDTGLVVAVLTRVATLWSAIVIGVVCLALAERRMQRHPMHPAPHSD